MTLIDVVKLVSQYIEDPKEANMNINFNESITFPELTFCMSRDQAWSHFQIDNTTLVDVNPEWEQEIKNSLANLTEKDVFLKAPWSTPMVVEAYRAIATLNSLERESTSQSARRDISAFAHGKKFGKVRKLVKDWLKVIHNRNVTFTEFQQKVGLETLKRSLREFTRIFRFGEEEEETTRLQNSTFKDIEEQGEFFRMKVLHNLEKMSEKKASTESSYEDECMILDFHGRPTTLARNMEGKGRVKDGTTEELCIGRIHEVRVDVRASYVMLPNNEKPTACRNYDQGDESEFDCRSRCRMEMIRQMCQCTGLTLQYLTTTDDLEQNPLCDYEKCGMKAKENYTDKLCADKCLPDCVQTRFNVLVDQKGRSVRPDLTMVTLIWGSFEYLKLEQQFQWNFTTFMAALGGSIGMWMGLSMLSLIQFLAYVTGTVTKKVTSKLSIAPSTPHLNEDGETRKISNNPFSGPVATNPFNSPFGGKDEKKHPSVSSMHSDGGSRTPKASY
uniref:Amiloride-sensitive sodium channel n=1 Tax=Ditylenchus dipsaci TaxID=166011 RepID=A0A915E437_9BILA